MKKIFILILAFYANLTFSQSTDTVIYVADKTEMVFIDKEGKEWLRKPTGKNVTIYYDKFWKSYTFYFDTENGEGFYKYKYVMEMPNNELGKTFKMTSGQNNEHIVYLTDVITNKGKIIVFHKELPDGGKAYMITENVKIK